MKIHLPETVNCSLARIAAAAAVLTLPAHFASGATETYNTAGTTNWVCPPGVTSVQVECWGGGGAGGAGTKITNSGTNTSQNGGGGGGGAYARRAVVPVTPGNSYTITIPAAAVSVAATSTTQVFSNGSPVTFVGDSSVTVTAAGGAGGGSIWRDTNQTAGGSAGAGGSVAASIGDAGAVFAGGAGSAGNTGGTNVSGSGGGGAGDANPGGAAVTTTSTTTPGAGGVAGGGAGGAGRTGGNTNEGVGAPGLTPGGGGGGAKNQGISSWLGGTGGLGQITITYDGPAIVKDNNVDDLNLTTSWVGGVVPDSTVRAKWDSTVAGANTTVLGANATWAGMQVVAPGGLVTINAGNTLTLGAAALDLDLSAATQDLTLNCDLAMSAANVWDVASGRTLTLGGAVSGSAGILKQGGGTAVLAGTTTHTGSTTVTGGTVNITGSITGNPASSKLNIHPAAGTAIVNYSGGASTLFAVTGANVVGTSSVFNMTAGNLTISPGITTGTQSVSGAGNSAGTGAYGFYNITGGTFKDTNRFTMTGRATASPTSGPASDIQTAVVHVGGTGFIDQTNGEWWLNYSLGQTTVADSGKIDRTGSTNPFGIFMDPTSGVTGGGYGVLNLSGANAQVILGAQPIRFGNSTTAGAGEGQSGFVNLAAGTLSVGANVTTSLPAAPVVVNNAYFNFAGGTVKATAALTGWIPVSNASINFNSNLFGPIDNSAVAGAPANFTGGLTLDTNGFAVAIANPLLAPAGAGVTQADLSVSGGSGYVGPPAVIFSSDGVIAGGSPAAGYALISGGAVAGIVITSPGTYTPGTTPTITLIGGGGTGASVTAGALGSLNASGGLTKTGGGTLTLSGANTYTGATLVSTGTLKFSTAGSAATDVTVANGAACGVLVAATDGQWINTADLTLNPNSAVVIDYGSTTPSTAVAPIAVDNLVPGTNLGLKIEAATFSGFVVSQTYPLITWTTSGPADGSAFTTILTPHFAGTFSVSGKTLLLTVTYNAAGLPISWNTGNETWNTALPPNWVDGNLTATTYVDLLDQVIFGDALGATGNPIITLDSVLSPAGVTMNSTSHDYTITGSGGISGAGGLTLDAANTKTLTLATANTYTGGTVINGGTLKLSGAGTPGAAGSNVAVSSGALLDLNGTSQAITFTAGTGVGTVANNSGGGTSTLTLTGTPTINGSLVTIQDNTDSSAGKVAVVITGNTQPLSNANTYSGGTTVNAGAFLYLLAAAPSGAGTGPIDLPALGANGAASSGLVVDGVTYANDITGAGYVHNNANSGATVVTTTLTGNINTSGPFIFRSGTGIVYNFAGDGTTSTLSGVIGSTTSMVNGAVATGSIIKSGTGTLTLSGANVYTGSTTVSAGTLNLAGNRTANAGTVTVGNLNGSTGILNVSNGTFQSGSVFVGAGDGTAVGVINQTGGTLTVSGDQLLLGNGGSGGTPAGNGGNGTYNLSGGTLTATAVANRGVMLGTNDGGTATFNLSGTGTLTLTGVSQLMVGRADSPVVNTTNLFNQTGGTASVTILSIGGAAAAATGLNSTFTVTGGTFGATSFTALGVGNSGVATINIGGTAVVTLPAFPTARGSGTTATINFDGGVLKPLTASATYMGGLTNAFIKAGGARFDTSNGSITITQDLLTDGVSTGGGLTKDGGNTLTLAGANTYTGGTIVNAGTLTLGHGSALGTGSASVTGGSLNLGGQAIANDVSVGTLGTLTGSGSTGAATLAGGVAPGGSGSGLITMASASVAASSSITLQLPAAGTRGTNYDALTVSGALALDGTITIDITGLTPTVGQSFDLIDSTGAIDLSNFTVAADLILPALSGSLVWDTSAFATTGVVSIADGDPFGAWALAKGLDGTPGKENGKADDPDKDGKTNLYEFALDGDPLSGANDGKVVGRIATVGSDQVLILTLPVRTGATFSTSSGDQLSALIDGIYYRIEGDLDLSTFGDTITEVTPAITAGMPTPLSSGWAYRTFRAPGTVPTVPKAFLRAKISETP